MESQFKKSDNNVLLLVILGAIIFFVFIMPMIDRANASEEAKLKEHLNNTNEPAVKIDKNMCSRQCCKFSQWPVPHDLHEKTIPDDQLKNYIGSNLSCNFGSGSGCLCVSKDDFNYLANRGGNSSSQMCGTQ